MKELPNNPTRKQLQGIGSQYYAPHGMSELTEQHFHEFCAVVHSHSATDLPYPQYKALLISTLSKVFHPDHLLGANP